MQASNDIRLLTSFFDHPKVLKLERRLGDAGVLRLIRLWAWVRDNRTDGLLTGMDEEDIEIAAKWDGPKGEFFKQLTLLGLIDMTESGYAIHDWKENQPWAAGQESRRLKARWNGLKAKYGEAGADLRCPDYRNTTSSSTSSMTSSMASSSTPLPSPPLLSSPKKKKTPLSPCQGERNVSPEDSIESTQASQNSQASLFPEATQPHKEEDTELSNTIAFWNQLADEKLVCAHASVVPSKSVLNGWKRVKRDKTLRTLIAMKDKIKAELQSSFVKDKTWFRLEDFLGGKCKLGEYKLQKLIDGFYRESQFVSSNGHANGHAVKPQPKRYRVKARASLGLIFANRAEAEYECKLKNIPLDAIAEYHG